MQKRYFRIRELASVPGRDGLLPVTPATVWRGVAARTFPDARAPRPFTVDTTAEWLQALVVERRGRMAIIFTDEAGQLGVMGGLYSNGQANLDVFLHGHAGGTLRVGRAPFSIAKNR